MAQRSFAGVLSYVRHLVGIPQGEDTGDSRLLQRFLDRQDEAAFATLLKRHGPLVLSVCQQVLHDPHAAEDAFQATFLILARKAASLRQHAALGAWLHRVAFNTATTAKTMAARRRIHERRAIQPMNTNPIAAAHDNDWCRVLHEEVNGLPAKYRLPIVLCYLQGQTNEEAARQLGWSKGTVSGRLARAREFLRLRLVRHGLTLSTAALGTYLQEGRVSASVPRTLEQDTVKGAVAFAAGRAVAGMVSESGAILAHGMLRAMTTGKWTVLVGICLALTCGMGAGLVCLHVFRDQPSVTESSAAAVQNLPVAAAVVPVPVARADVPDKADTEAARRVDALGDPLPAGARLRIGTVRLRHADTVDHLAFAADGKTLVSASEDGTLRAWDIVTGKESRRFFSGERTGLSDAQRRFFALSPNGRLLAANRKDKLCIFDTASGAIVNGFDGPATPFTFTPDGKELIAVYQDHVTHWDLASGKELRRWSHMKEVGVLFKLLVGVVSAECAFSADSRTLAVAEFAEKKAFIRLWDIPNAQKIHEWRGHDQRIRALTFGPDGKVLLSASDDRSMRLWELPSGKELRRWQSSPDPDGPPGVATYGYRKIAISPDGGTIASTGDGGLKLWDISTGKELRDLKFERGRVTGHVGNGPIAFSPDGKTIASEVGHHVHELTLWEVATGKEVSPLVAYPEPITDLGYSADGNLLITGAGNGLVSKTIQLRDPLTGRVMREFPKTDFFRFSPDGKTLGLFQDGSETQEKAGVLVSEPILRVRLLKADTAEEIRKFEVRGESGQPIAWSPDGKVLATHRTAWDEEKTQEAVCVWDVATGRKLRRFPGDVVVCSPDVRMIAVGMPQEGKPRPKAMPGRITALENGTIRLFEPTTGKDIGQLAGSSFFLEWLSVRSRGTMPFNPVFSPDGKVLAAAKANGKKLCLWDLSSRDMLAQFDTRDYLPLGNYPPSTLFSPDGRYVVLHNHDDVLCLMEASTGKVNRRFEREQQETIHQSVFSRDGKLLAAEYRDGVICLWDVATGKEALRLQGYGGRVQRMAFAPDGNSLAATLADGTALVWNLADRKP